MPLKPAPSLPIGRPRSPSRSEQRHPTSVRSVAVRRVETIAPAMVRVTFSGPEIRAHQTGDYAVPAMASSGFDDVVVLCFPRPDTGLPDSFRVSDSGELIRLSTDDWCAREYTVRSYDSARAEFCVDFALHNGGIADDWVRSAQPGDVISVVAPRVSRAAPEANSMLTVADASALPALCRLAESAADTCSVRCIVVGERSRVGQCLPAALVNNTRWIEDADHLEAALAEECDEDQPFEFAWVAGEAALVKTARRLLVNTHGLEKSAVQFTGYWRAGAPALME